MILLIVPNMVGNISEVYNSCDLEMRAPEYFPWKNRLNIDLFAKSPLWESLFFVFQKYCSTRPTDVSYYWKCQKYGKQFEINIQKMRSDCSLNCLTVKFQVIKYAEYHEKINNFPFSHKTKRQKKHIINQNEIEFVKRSKILSKSKF